MKKILPILVIGILVLSGLGAAAVTNNVNVEDKNIETLSLSDSQEFSFSQLSFKDSDEEYLEVDFIQTTTHLSEPGKPYLPKVVKTFEIPFGATNVKVDVDVKNLVETNIQKEVKPSPQPVPLTATEIEYTPKVAKNNAVYESNELYPSEWFDYRVLCGLNNENVRTTFVVVPIYPVRYSPGLDKLIVAESADIKITYDSPESNPISTSCEYDMVVIAPRFFSFALKKLVNHKNNVGVKTYLKTTESIYKAYDGVDKPEEIKLFIQDAIEEHNISYVLLVGGLKNQIWANPREHKNYGAKKWYLPVRYHNFWDDPEHPLSMEKINDPGVISDLYYADVYKEGGEFENWDSNGDGLIGAWNYPDPSYENDTLDLVPDVAVGRLACRSLKEVRDVVNKIINYEKTTYGQEWFKKMIVFSGDGFMDQEDLDFQWDTNGLPNGDYTIYAQSKTDDKPFGIPDVIPITINKNIASSIYFNHDDHLRIDSYPTEPIAEIVSISPGDNLGCNDSVQIITEKYAYGNSFSNWANINYTDGILHIRGKTYDPSPYGFTTDIHVWVLNENDEVVFDDWRCGQEMYYEGEWVTGDKTLLGGGGALYYLPEGFEKEIVWASNGKLRGPDDVVKYLSQGCGFAFLSGHGSPNVWTDHFPGIPGNRAGGSIPYIGVVKFGPKALPIIPSFPLKKLSNTYKLPVTLIGGCHNSQFNVSMIPGLLDLHNEKNTWCHGAPVPECFSWYLVKLPKTGSIATIGNTGLGYGVIGKECLVEGFDGGICIEFMKQYRELYDTEGYGNLGDVYKNTQVSYCNQFDMDFLDHAKSLTQWVLLGDPSLRIGGYQ